MFFFFDVVDSSLPFFIFTFMGAMQTLGVDVREDPVSFCNKQEKKSSEFGSIFRILELRPEKERKGKRKR